MQFIADDSEFAQNVAAGTNIVAEFRDLGYNPDQLDLDEVLVVLEGLDPDSLTFASVGDDFHECWRSTDLDKDQVAALHDALGKWLESRP